MAIKVDLTPFLPLYPLTEPSSISQNWKSWKVGLETYLVALNTTEDMQKRELLLYQAGQATQKVFDSYTETGEDFATVMTKLDGYYRPNKCHNCGSAWPHKDGICPGKGRTCRKCGKPKHFAKFCFTTQNIRQNPRETQARQPHPTAKSPVHQISQDQSSYSSKDK